MDGSLGEAFRYSAWASSALIDACRGLAVEQLTSPAPGYGSIMATFNHFILSDAGYAAILGAPRPDWSASEEETDSLDHLRSRVDETAAEWERLMAGPIDPERLLILEEGAYECRASVVVVQAIHHGNAHREQISAALTRLGIEPPDAQPWEYADTTGRATWRRARE